MNRIRMTAIAALFVATVPATAKAQTFWDFVALNGSITTAPGGAPFGPLSQGSPPQSYTSRTLCNGTLGCVDLSSNTAGVKVLFKWNSPNVQIGDEKGVGLCQPDGAVCDGDEIGQLAGSPWLLLNLTSFSPNVAVTSVRIASLSGGEAFKFDLCTTATSGCGSEIVTPVGGATQSIFDVAVSQGAAKWIRFKPGTGDYIVQGITTTVPEPGTMALLAAGLVGLAGAGSLRRRNRKQS